MPSRSYQVGGGRDKRQVQSKCATAERSFMKWDLLYFSWNVASFFEEGFVCKAQNYGSPSNFRNKLSIILRVSVPVMSQAQSYDLNYFLRASYLHDLFN